jgi:hypothetical protein
MKSKPRTLVALASAPLVCVLASDLPAQTRQARAATTQAPQAASKQGSNKKTDAAAAHATREMREAVAALREVADAARSFDDLYESALVQSEAADALWPFDEQAARAILRRAWEAATAPGAVDKLKGYGTSDDERDQALEALMTARRFIIKSAMRRDPRLGDAFMREFEHDLADISTGAQRVRTSEQPDEQSDADSPQRNGRRLSPGGLQRLTVAEQLLADGDFKRAAELAATVVGEGPNIELLKFILDLRAHDTREADALYLRLLDVTRADASADANDVLLLSTPVVSPSLDVSVNPDGSANLQVLYYDDEDARRAASSLPAQARLAFYDVAASVLLRPDAPRGDGQTGADTSSDYFAIGRLLPFFEREAAQLAPALHARQGALAAEIDASRRDALASKMDVSSLSSKNPSDPLASNLDQIARSANPSERDLLRLMAVDAATRLRLWDRARGIAEEVEDMEARRGARLIIAVRQVTSISRSFDGDEPDTFVRAADFARAADVPPEVRAVGLAQAAELAAHRGKRARASELLAEAEGYAGQAERGERRVTALALVTLSAAQADPVRFWELLQSLARAGNEADDLPLAGLNLEFIVGAENNWYGFFAPVAPAKLPEVFAAAAQLDFTRTLAEARTLKDEVLRARATLAAARAALERSPRARGAR